MSNRVVITGIGPVTSVGIGVDEFFEQIWAGQPQIRPIPASFGRGYSLHSGFYVPLPEVSFANQGLGIAQENLMQSEDKMVILAAKLALEDAGFACRNAQGRFLVEGLPQVSMTLGTGLTGMQTAFESYMSHTLPKELLQSALPDRKLVFNRMVVPKTMPDSPAAWASIMFGLKGPCLALNASCASGTYAIGEAFQRIRFGSSVLALAGGVESLVDPGGFMMRGFDVLGVLTRSSDGRPAPFSKNRSGFLFAEGGACLLVLEELQHARARNARIYAEISGYSANSDAYSILQIDPEARQIKGLLSELAAGQKIDYLNSHGTATVANDQIEAESIRAVFGTQSNQPLINSTKGILGHTLGASGAIEAAVTALSIARSSVHGNLTLDPVDDLNLPLQSVNCEVRAAISVSYGFGGHNAGLLLTRFEENS
jgi:3-oxoacyl-[acyl-carrier-protein] synthase II